MVSIIVWATAEYRTARPGIIKVTEKVSQKVSDHRLPADAAEPPARLPLAPTPWTAAPGSIWHERGEGVWHIAVYQHRAAAKLPAGGACFALPPGY